MRYAAKLALLAAFAALILSLTACRQKPVVQLAPAPVTLPSEPAQPDTLRRGRESSEAIAPGAPAPTSPYDEPSEGVAPAPRVQSGAVALHGRTRSSVKPRMAILINRKFAGSLEEWESDSRILITESYDETSREAGRASSTQGGKTTTIVAQDRVGGERNAGLSEDRLWAVQEQFSAPLRQAGYALIDPEVATRLEAREGSETDALRNSADCLVELLITPASSGSDGWVLSAKAVDLRSARVLATVNSQRLPRAPRFAGGRAPQGASPEQIARDLSSALIEQLH
jgi:hypothetical protein